MTKDFINLTKVSSETLMELGKFSLLWAQFELVYFDNDCTSNKLRYLNNVSKFNTIYDKLLTPMQQLVSELLDYLEETKETITLNDFHKRLYSQEYKGYFTEADNVIKNDTQGLELILGVLQIIFRLRSNLFHGLKDCYAINKQVDLFKKVNAVLNAFIINEYLID